MIVESYRGDLGAGLRGLRRSSRELGVPGPHDVIVRVRAVSLNARELMILGGYYPLPIRPDLVMVSDGAGEVEFAGERVTRVKPGDRIMASVFARWVDGSFSTAYADQLGGSLDGMLSERVILNEESLVHVPEHLSYEEAATLPCAGVTAWNALTEGVHLLPGQTVLLIGSGGVSLFALQFAKVFGARVVATTSSSAKAQRLRELGADHVINYREVPQWDRAVRQFTRDLGADLIVEVGGIETLARSIRSAAIGAHIASVGMLGGRDGAIDAKDLMAGIYTMRRVALGNRRHFEAMNRAIGQHQLRPVIDRVFPFDKTSEAFSYYAERNALGKIVISL